MIKLVFALLFLAYTGCTSFHSLSKRNLQNASISQNQPDEATIDWCNKNVINISILNENQKASIYFVVGQYKRYIDRIGINREFYLKYLTEKDWPPYVTDGLIIYLLREGEKFTDIKQVQHLRGKKVNEIYKGYGDGPSGNRLIDDISGEGSHRMVVVKAGKIPNQVHGSYNTFYHEFAHLLHQSAFSVEQIKELEKLYLNAKSKGIFLDDYAATNETEYFAVGFEAYVSKFKNDKSWIYYRHERKDLEVKDPELFKFIEKLL